MYPDGREARELTDGQRVVEDLLRRDVIEPAAEGRYRIKVGLFAEWLSHKGPERMPDTSHVALPGQGHANPFATVGHPVHG
ncbi:hypothetical protein [Streptomyces shenzhenensis]|uniref:hypothetical protein n=1 Tax=Streptomyces shenzhenensis TaxID=943815 RepID=UPI0015F0BB53|nr:hypothetical protein [Streptomyces shenzhenensis]